MAEVTLDIPSDDLLKGLRQVIPAAAKEESRPILRGVGVLKTVAPWRIDGDGDTVVAERRPRKADGTVRRSPHTMRADKPPTDKELERRSRRKR